MTNNPTLFTGLRQREVLGLTWDCVDFQTDTLYINKQLQKTKKVGGTYLLVPTKNGKGRTITAAPSVMAVLRKQKTRQAQMQLAAGPAWENSDVAEDASAVRRQDGAVHPQRLVL